MGVVVGMDPISFIRHPDWSTVLPSPRVCGRRRVIPSKFKDKLLLNEAANVRYD